METSWELPSAASAESLGKVVSLDDITAISEPASGFATPRPMSPLRMPEPAPEVNQGRVADIMELFQVMLMQMISVVSAAKSSIYGRTADRVSSISGRTVEFMSSIYGRTADLKSSIYGRTADLKSSIYARLPTSARVLKLGLGMTVVVVLVGLVIGTLYVTSVIGKRADSMAALQGFVSSESSERIIPSHKINSLVLDTFNEYQTGSCVQGADSWQALRTALNRTLGQIPGEVKEMALNTAVIEGIRVNQALVQDTVVSPDSQWKAYAYKLWFHTDGIALSSCVLVSGVQLTLPTEVAAWETETVRVQIGQRPCHCGLFSCESCPEYDFRTTKTPRFKLHRLTLEDQEMLTARMRTRMVSFGQGILASYGLAIPEQVLAGAPQATKDTSKHDEL